MSDFKRCNTCGNPVDPEQAKAHDGACPWCLAAFALDAEPAAAFPRFGKYVRVERLGSGGMGEVWKGLDTELNRPVALKFLKDRDPLELARFRREAQTAAGLSHPNIAAIYEIGEQEGCPFIAMQYVAGRTIATLARDERKLIVRLIAEAARAVDHAHRQGIIHRDLKPENLMVEKSDDGFRVVVLDFGLARHIEGGEKLSMSGDVVGTPAYMSPEQARAEKLDARADVYSLGATLYELVTGKPPFEGPNLLEMIRKVGAEDPVRPRKVDPKIHRDLETIILKCLEKDRARRYASARDLAEDLDRFRNLEPIVARPPSTIYRLRMKLAKRKAVVAVAAAGLLVAAGLGVGLMKSRAEDRTFRNESSRREAAMKEASSRREALIQEAGALWSRMVEAKQALHILPENMAVEAPRVRDGIQRVINDVEGFIARNPALPHGYYIRARGRSYLENIAGAEKDLRKAIQLDPEFAPAHAMLGRVLIDLYMLVRTDDNNLGMLLTMVMLMIVKKDPDKVLEEARSSLIRGRTPAGAEASRGLPRTREDEVSEVLLKATLLYFVDGKLEEAMRELKAETERNPSEEYLNWLGRLATDPEEKIKWHNRAITRRPFFATAYIERSFARCAVAMKGKEGMGMTAEARKALVPMLEDLETAFVISRNPMIRLLVVMIHKMTENRDQAAALLEEWREADFEDIDRAAAGEFLSLLLMMRAEAREERGNVAGALEDVNLLLKRVPDETGAVLHRAKLRYKTGDRVGADADLEAYLRKEPGMAEEAHLLRGGWLKAENRLKEAEAEYRKAMELSKPGGSTHGEAEEAIALLGSDVTFSPRKLFNESYYLHRAKEYRKAIEGYRKIVDAMPATNLARTSAFNVACGYALLGEKDNALEWLEKSVELGWKDAAYMEKDSDFDSIRGEERYKKLVERLKAK
jgi:serine/threonine protein kinase